MLRVLGFRLGPGCRAFTGTLKKEGKSDSRTW